MDRESSELLPTLIPSLSCHDATAALEWLSEAFGFTTTVDYRDPDGSVMHAEMCLGNGAIMLGTSIPAQPGGSNRLAAVEQGIYVYVTDVDAPYRCAASAGANIVFPPEDSEWGSRRYRALDPEGHEWSVGNYGPSPTYSRTTRA